jgi:hypothetical protein
MATYLLNGNLVASTLKDVPLLHALFLRLVSALQISKMFIFICTLRAFLKKLQLI